MTLQTTIPPIQQVSLIQAEIDTLMQGVNLVQKPIEERIADCEALIKCLSRDLLIAIKRIEQLERKDHD